MKEIEFIIYVKDQNKSRDFYKLILDMEPCLDVSGMTEFQINNICKLGIMPENGIAKILGDALPHPATGNGIPRAEIYLFVESPELQLKKAIDAGAKLISDTKLRDWNHYVGYASDPDGHIIAFARKK